VANYGVAQTKSIEKEVKWARLPRGTLKFNIDASFYANISRATGAILGNEK
jgi:hypothetical protein